MAKLAFVVARPTQIEAPFYKHISKKGSDLINVYYFKNVSTTFHDSELGKNIENTWGIDLVSGYSWRLIQEKYFLNAFSVVKKNNYTIINGYTQLFSLYILLIGFFLNKKIGLRLDTVLWNQGTLLKRVYKHILLRILSLFVDVFWVTGAKSKEYLIYFGISSKNKNAIIYC